jgi:hypothetical protein
LLNRHARYICGEPIGFDEPTNDSANGIDRSSGAPALRIDCTVMDERLNRASLALVLI